MESRSGAWSIRSDSGNEPDRFRRILKYALGQLPPVRLRLTCRGSCFGTHPFRHWSTSRHRHAHTERSSYHNNKNGGRAEALPAAADSAELRGSPRRLRLGGAPRLSRWGEWNAFRGGAGCRGGRVRSRGESTESGMPWSSAESAAAGRAFRSGESAERAEHAPRRGERHSPRSRKHKF